jgi:nitroreductase
VALVDVYEAVTSRRAVRGFTDQPVPKEVLERVLAAAAWSPSGSNLQPWHIYVLTGDPLVQVKMLAVHRVGAGDPWDEREFEMYPPELKSPYHERRAAFAKQRYARSALRARIWKPVSGPPSPIGTASGRPPRCFATSTATWGCRNGPTSACTCKP